ncbi:MAG: hypothetical protein HOP12_09300 [Candidatus Eisenbacteria bacterium]|uniref:Uncharacterized protein n=1 Tax=Eiseniibacteriota bacterium TaxID=2212470 RepID=A0A849SIU6_UNCEI|nr:hypothetical protein [Candidatus Eisenbacteria bacterium]
MLRHPLVRLAIFLAILGFAWFNRTYAPFDRPAGVGAEARADHPPASATKAKMVGHPEIGFRSPELLGQHFAKHGREFFVPNAAAYLELAQLLRDREVEGDVLEAVRADHVVTRFDRHSGAFLAFDRDLTIRTFFRPNDGEQYFRRQLARAENPR